MAGRRWTSDAGASTLARTAARVATRLRAGAQAHCRSRSRPPQQRRHPEDARLDAQGRSPTPTSPRTSTSTASSDDQRAQGGVPRRHRVADLRARRTRTATSAAHLFGYVREVNERPTQDGQLRGRASGRPRRPGRSRARVRPLPARPAALQRVEVDVGGPGAQQAAGHGAGDRPEPATDARQGRAAGRRGARFRVGAGGHPTHGAAFVAMDIADGEIVGMGSYPTFDPGVYTGVLKQSTYKRLSSKANGLPLVNRAIAAQYPPGSTFKPITVDRQPARPASSTPGTSIDDGGSLGVRRPQVAERRQGRNGPVNMRDALQGLHRHLLLPAGPQAVPARRPGRSRAEAARSGPRPDRRHRPARRRRRARCPTAEARQEARPGAPCRTPATT